MTNNSRVFFGFSLMMVCFFVFLKIKVHEEDINYHFNGRIDCVSFDIKGSPTITVGRKSYYLSDDDWLIATKFESGDLVVKKSGVMTIKLIRHKTGEVTFIKEAAQAF